MVNQILLPIYVNEMITTCDDYDGIESPKCDLAYCFAMKDLGMVCYFWFLKLLNQTVLSFVLVELYLRCI